MQLVANARHLQPADDLAVGGALRVGVDGRQVVRVLDAGADIEGDCVKELLARGLHRLRRRCITRPAAMRSAMLSHVAPPAFALPATRVTQSAAARSNQFSRSHETICSKSHALMSVFKGVGHDGQRGAWMGSWRRKA